jgi:uncharacterized membrane protein YsdA (DUF1294 family)
MLLAALGYMVAVNLATYALFAVDKRRAIEGDRRLPEKQLLLWSALGGVFGATLAQQRLRHKTRKEPFRTLLLGLLVFWCVFLLAMTAPDLRGAVFDRLAEVAGR